MKFIKLTNLKDEQPIYINVDQIGHFYHQENKIEYGRITKPSLTCVGVTTHNNGGFEVKETIEEILHLIKCNN